MKLKFLGLLLITSVAASAQIIAEYVYRNPADSSYNCYLKLIPENQKIKGLVVRDFSSLPDTSKTSPYRYTGLATQNGLVVLFTVTSNYFPELYYNFDGAAILDEIIHEVITDHNIPKENLIIGGMSASGTRAARYVQYCHAGHSKNKLKPKGLFLTDSPLDLERFYISSDQHMPNFKAGMLEEAEWMLRTFPEKFNATAYQTPEVYRKNSVFSHKLPMGGNAQFFVNTPIIIFHEPDINWWIEERGCSYYDINSYDLAAFTNTLRQLGNEQVELISTSGKGFDRQGNRKPHSWTIVDEDYLINWMLNVLNE